MKNKSHEELSAVVATVVPIILESLTKICKEHGVSLRLILKIIGLSKIQQKNNNEL